MSSFLSSTLVVATNRVMLPDDGSSHQLSSNESPSDARDRKTLSELKMKMTESGKTTVNTDDKEDSNDSSGSSRDDHTSSPTISTEKNPTRQKRNGTIKTPKKKARTKKLSEIESDDASKYSSESFSRRRGEISAPVPCSLGFM